MKTFSKSFNVIAAAAFFVAAGHHADAQEIGDLAAPRDVIAFWDFNNGFDGGDGATQIAHPATVGEGVIYQQRADIDGNGKAGNDYSDVLFGLAAEAGRSLVWDDVAKSGDNDAELFLAVSTSGYQDIEISFDMRGNDGDGITRYDLKYDTNQLVDIDFGGATIKDFAGGQSTTFDGNVDIVTSPTEFTRTLIDLSGVIAANDQANFGFRIDDIKENDELRFDNFLVTGTPITVPEPSVFRLLGLVGVSGVIRRKAFVGRGL